MFFTPVCDSVHGRGVSVQGEGLCPGGWCLSGEGGVLGPLSAGGGGSVRETPPYGYVRTVRILLECILVVEIVRQIPINFFS